MSKERARLDMAHKADELIIIALRKQAKELERAELARCAEECEKQSEYEGGLLDLIAELEEELFKQSQESKEEVSRAIEIILEKDAKIAELEHSVQLKHYKLHKALRLRDSANERIAELEKKVKHLNQVVYNTAKVAFEAGACCPDVDFHQSAILFAKELLKEQGE
jgi:hypothetical protein